MTGGGKITKTKVVFNAETLIDETIAKIKARRKEKNYQTEVVQNPCRKDKKDCIINNFKQSFEDEEKLRKKIRSSLEKTYEDGKNAPDFIEEVKIKDNKK